MLLVHTFSTVHGPARTELSRIDERNCQESMLGPCLISPSSSDRLGFRRAWPVSGLRSSPIATVSLHTGRTRMFLSAGVDNLHTHFLVRSVFPCHILLWEEFGVLLNP